ncbi:unnamed protein product [Chironomus riparius]|uniref:Uncharacterized protein n=1 Tax=Chironomus riparius TaxID=315576 RepID=A0A9N9WUF4_9DIPT|nr:unnamed protein product [Chironomus riparius]
MLASKIIVFILLYNFISAQDNTYRTGFLNLPLDHYSSFNPRTWDIRYLINENLYRENGPIFIFVGGSDEITPEFILRGNMFEVAQSQGGVMVALEHRYFGQSLPTTDASFDNLQWLTVHQAVADIGRFAGFMRQRYLDAPVILWGRNYGGSLAVWARQKYPNVIDGAWSSSSPLNAIVENVDYFPNVFRTINNIGGSECGQILADAFRFMEESFVERNTSFMEQRLKFCTPLDHDSGYDIARATNWIAQDIGENFVSNARYPDIDEKCRIMRGVDQPNNPPSNALDAFARWYIDDFNSEIDCLTVTNDEVVAQFQATEWESDASSTGRRQRFWLSCTQMGQLATANNGEGHPFGTRFDLRFYEQWCVDAFQNDIFLDPWFMQDSIGTVNRLFGGLNPGVFRVFLTHGELDPIRTLGPNSDLNRLSSVVVMSLQSHSRDMGSPDDADYVVLRDTKLRVQQAVNDWIEYARFGDPEPPPPPSPPEFHVRWFNLPIDHFTSTNPRTWDIRYLINENLYRENGPIFIFVGGSDEITPEFILRGNMFEVAQSQGGVMVALEHRYFGQSLPTTDASFDNLQWLTVHQAVADIGRFAGFMRQRYLDAPVILWGRNYGGSLAVWARQKYPNVIDGAWSSSSPLNAIVENVDYFPNVFRTINNIGGSECGQILADAFRFMEESFVERNTSFMEQRLKFCTPLDHDSGYDIARATNWIAQDIGENFVSNARYPDIDEKCRIMRGVDQPNNPPSNALDAFARWYIDDFNSEIDCLTVTNDEVVAQFQATEWESDASSTGRRQRFWLSCTQMGQLATANNGEGHPFGTRFDLRFYEQWCVDAFQNDIFLDPWFMQDSIGTVNRLFGGLNPGVFRVFLTHGELDPIRTLGPNSDLNRLSSVVVMSLQSHSRDMGSPDDADYVVLRDTKLRVQQAVNDWIEYARFGDPEPPPPPSPPEFHVRWFNLPIDHFTSTNPRTWDIRYLINENLYRENGPIFIFVGGSDQITPEFILRGNMFEVAQSQGGVMVALEHRYFGQSLPTTDASFDNLQWLTVHQAVADIGRFAGFMRQRYLDAPVILWGRNYGGSLAVWARQKYPNVIDGAWSSSSPLNAIVENVDYFPNVFRTINNIGGSECGQILADAFRFMEESFVERNTSFMEQRLKFCTPLDHDSGYDITRATNWIAQDIGENFVSNARYPDIDEKCRIMRGVDQPNNPPSNALDAFARWYIDDFNSEIDCLAVTNDEVVAQFQATEWESDASSTGRRQRFWLSCTQMGQLATANNGEGHPFGTRFDLRFYEQWCVDAFQNDIFLDPWFMQDSIGTVNRLFGGLNPGVFRVFLTHGELDPIRTLGPNSDLNRLSSVVVMSLQSHSRDMGSPDDADYVVLRDTKLRVQQAVNDWIEYARFGDPEPPPPPSPPEFHVRWFNLPIDHFTSTNPRTWDIRYLINENLYRENGPIFIFVGGSDEITPEFILRGNMFEVAQSQGGVMVALEHRYFGQSLPTTDASFDNLQWLTVHQAVADIGRFAGFMRQRYLDAPVILWGRNYGGSLAVWARQKYPNVIDGAWSSSSPLNAIVENVDYFPNVFRTINNIGGSECGQILADAFRFMEESFVERNTSFMEQRLKFCTPLDHDSGYDIARATNWIAQDIGENFVSNARYPDIDEKCRIMRGVDQPNNPPSNALDAFARWYIDDFNSEIDCLAVTNDEVVAQFQATEWESDTSSTGRRQRYWLSCTQMGQLATANNGEGHPFGTRFDLRFYEQWCVDAFQNDIFLDPWFMQDSIGTVNRLFGGLNPSVFRVFLTHGELDPIRTLGPNSDLNRLSSVVVMSLQSHSRDMGSPDDADYVVLRDTKLRVQQAVNDWIEYARFELLV